MRILLLSDYGAPTRGAEIALFTLRDGLRRRGHEVLFLTSSAAPDGATIEADRQCLGTVGRARTLLQTFNPSAWYALRETLRDFRPDVVHVGLFLTQLSPLILPPLRRVPSLYHVHWYRAVCPIGTKIRPDGTDCPTPAGTVWYRSGCLTLRDWVPLMCQMKVWRHWSSAFGLIVANSEATRRRLIAEGVQVSDVIWNGVPRRPRRPPLSDPPTVAFAGRFVPEKGIHVLFRAFTRVLREVPAARLLLAGRGPALEQVERLSSHFRLGAQVTFLGHLSPPALEQHLGPAWVQAVPSLWAEPFGLVAAEAMMRGTAVVASGVGGLPDIVRDGQSGVLVPPGDEEALARALSRLLSQRDEAESMGEAGRAIAERQFDEDTYVERFIECYRALLTSWNRAECSPT